MEREQIPAKGRDRTSGEPSRDVTAGATPPPDAETLAAFGLADEAPVPLPGGEERVFRVCDAVLKHLGHGRADVVAWTADLHDGIREDGFRVSRPLPTTSSRWVTADGWSAWTFLDGHHDYRGRIPESVAAIERYHAALQAYDHPPILETIDNPWTRADRQAFWDRPAEVHPELAQQVAALYAIRQPLRGLHDQLIHGDLNPGNMLIADGLPPGIIDVAPYWRPASYALAVYAYWIGPWWDAMDRLEHFAHVDQFDQLLIRAGLRMLLTMSESGRLTDMKRYARATRLILERSS
jgi:uncharacterized protein (TIGR02569 family)